MPATYPAGSRPLLWLRAIFDQGRQKRIDPGQFPEDFTAAPSINAPEQLRLSGYSGLRGWPFAEAKAERLRRDR